MSSAFRPADPVPAELKVDPQLVSRLKAVVTKREQVNELLRKAEAQRAQVKPAIHAKVVADYQGRLQQIAAELRPLAEDVQRALIGVREREKALRQKMQEVTDDLEEQRFRAQIGEFAAKELEPKERELVEKQTQLAAHLAAAEATLAECKALLGDTPLKVEPKTVISGESALPPRLLPVTPAAAAPPAVAAATPLVRVPSKPPPPPPPDEHPTAVNPPPNLAVPPTAAAPQPHPHPAPTPPPSRPAAEPAPASPATAVSAIRVLHKDAEPELFPLSGDKVSIGRSPKSDIVLKVAGVSRTHAHIVRASDGRFAIIDTSGGDGLTINGEKQRKAVLNPGDRITIASIELEVVAG
jgi:hypothetical protein